MTDFVLYYSLAVGSIFVFWLAYVVRLYLKIWKDKSDS